MIFVLPSFANIDAENDSPTCDESVLNASNGTANLEINWEPNVIPLRWYSGNTLLEPENNDDTCTYDGVLNRPTNPTREGYNFAGWRVRPMMEFSESTLGLSGYPQTWSKDNVCRYNNKGYNPETITCSSDNHFFDLQQKEYKMLYPNGKMLYGMSKCSARVGNNYSGTYPIKNKSDWFEPSTANLDNATGNKNYCWCKATGFRETEQGSLYAPSNTLGWIMAYSYHSRADWCVNGGCALSCAYYTNVGQSRRASFSPVD